MTKEKTGTFDQKEYNKAYNREHIVYRKMNLNNSIPEDQEILNWLDSREEKTSVYLKRLVLEDMKRGQHND